MVVQTLLTKLNLTNMKPQDKKGEKGFVVTLNPSKCCYCGLDEKENGIITHPHKFNCSLITGKLL